MSIDPKEKARLEKLRRAQIAQRNPGESKIKGYDWSQHNKKSREVAKKRAERSIFSELYEIIPNRWKGAAAGFAFGAVIALFLVVVVLPDETDFLALVPLLLCSIVGMIIGKAMQPDEPKY